MANLYSCWFKDADWICLVVAETGRKARRPFFRGVVVIREHEDQGRFIDIRVRLLKKHVPYPIGVYDDESEEWTREWYCCKELGECHCRGCREESEEEQ